MVTSSETIVGTKIFLGNFKLLCTRHVGTRLYRSFSIVGGGTVGMGWSSDYIDKNKLTEAETGPDFL